MDNRPNNPFPKEEFRKEFVVNIVIGFIVAEIMFLYLCNKIGEREFALIAIPYIFFYFISKIGLYKYSFLFGVFSLYLLSYHQLLTIGRDIFPTLICLSLLLVIIYAVADTGYACLHTVLSFLMILTSKQPIFYQQTHLNLVQQYMFFPLTAGVTLCVGWLPNQRIKESLRKIRRSEYLLRIERDMLDIRLSQRTGNLLKLAELGSDARKMIHDISTPLNLIMLNVEHIDPSNITVTKEMLRRAQAGAELMLKFVGEMRDRIVEQDKMSWFSITNAIETTKNICECKNVRVRNICAEGLKIYGYEARFLQVMINITQNSVEAYEEKKGLIKIKTELYEDRITIKVSDKGKGMDQNMLENLGSFTTKSDKALNGIGFDAAKEITERDFHGVISTKSTKGKGTTTTIQIRVPVRTDNDPPRQLQPLP